MLLIIFAGIALVLGSWGWTIFWLIIFIIWESLDIGFEIVPAAEEDDDI